MPGKKHSEIIDAIAEDLRSGVYTHAYVSLFNLESDRFVFEYQTPKPETIFDLGSLTKALVTTPLVISAIAESNWQTPTRSWLQLPDELDHLGELSVEELMRHHSGLPAWRNFYVCRWDEERSRERWMRERLSKIAVDPTWKGKDRYSDVGMILLTLILELHTGRRLDQLFQSLRHQIVGDSNIDLDFQPRLKRKCVPTGYCNLRHRILQGEVWDENASALDGVSGHAGLFASGASLNQWVSLLFKSPLGQHLLGLQDAFFEPDQPPLFGWRLGNDVSSAAFGSGKAKGHMGFTGVAFWVDGNDVAVFLTNRVVSSRVNPDFKLIRQRVFGQLNELRS